MVKKIKKVLGKFNISRTTVLLIVFMVMSFVLIHRLFKLQIVDGQEYADNFSLRTTKERTLKSTRGNIYDRNGNILAHNELSYSITLEDSGTYASNRERNLSLNSEIYKINQIIEENGDSLDEDFHIILENGQYTFNVTEFTLDRFKADIFGHQLIDELIAEEKNASADMIMEYLSYDRFAIYRKADNSPYTKEELKEYGLPETYTKEEQLKMVTVRYLLSTTSYKKYVPVTIASEVSENTVAAVMEDQSSLTGVDIQEDSSRVYTDTDSVYFASLLGYTGKASSEEIEKLKEENPNYSTAAIIGKTGIEETMELTLQGKDGKETVYVDNLGKVLQIDEASRTDPVQGNDVYLTIDKELQISVYKILEQRIAGILVNNIRDIHKIEVDENTDTATIPIPIYDVYNALINNSLIDINHFSEGDASAAEQAVYGKFAAKQEQIFNVITQELTGDDPMIYKDMSEELKSYISYIVNELLMEKTQILSETSIDKSDKTYIDWTKNETISLQEYLTYAASQNWINMSSVLEEQTYLNAKEAYQELAKFIADYLKTDVAFSKLLYKYLIMDDVISGSELCTILYDQGILKTDNDDYVQFASGTMNSYDLLRQKIGNLEITPAQLALDPCSGSAVVVDPDSGEIRACVTYPSYDNNRLANQMDAAYYKQLNSDLSEPFYNKATQQRTAPGSTFKIVTTVAGLTEGVIDDESTVNCTGAFDKIEGSILNCWDRTGHSILNIRGAIQNSCNVFFSEVAYRLGQDESTVFSDSAATQKLQTYAKMFDLDKNSGIEISEASPQISDAMPIPSAIGQGTHNYTTSQLARYITTIANSGTSYNISLLDKTTDPNGNLIEDFTPQIESKLEVADYIWDDIHIGMRGVITETNNDIFGDLDITLAGKTGTAQQAKNRASHGVFIGYAPYDQPQISIAVRIAYGYTSKNAGLVAKDVCNYYFDLKPEDEILTGKAAVEGISASGETQTTD